MPGSFDRLYHAESVALALEVKSNIAAQWDQVENSVRTLRPVRRRWKGSTRHIAAGIQFSSASDSTVPYVAVGFKTCESLVDRINATPVDARPDAVLVIDPGAFASSNGMEASDCMALYALCIHMTDYLRDAAWGESDLSEYVK